MTLNYEKVTFGRKSNVSPVVVPEHLRQLDFEALADLVQATCSGPGIALVAALRETINAASCTPCERSSAAARLRVWLASR